MGLNRNPIRPIGLAGSRRPVFPSDEQLSFAQDAAQAGFFEVDLKTRFLTASEPLLRLFGIVPGTVVHSVEDLLSSVHPDDLQGARAGMEKTLKECREYHSEYRIIWPDGSVHSLEARGRVMRDASGAPQSLAGMMFEITGRMAAQEEQKRSAQRFRVALDSSPVSILEMDRDLRYTWIHRSRSEIDTSALIGRTDEELLGPEQFQKVDAVRRAVLEGGEGARTDFSLVIQGVRHSFDATIEPLRGRSGEVTGLSIVLVDITARKGAEDALIERESNSRRFIEVSPFGMAGRTMDGRVRYANNAFLELIGATQQDLAMGRPDWKTIVPPDCQGAEARAVAEVEQHGLVPPYETEYLHRDGSRVPVLVSQAIFSSGGMTGIIAYCVDLTNLKRAEEKSVQLTLELEARNEDLACKNRQLDEASRRKTQFLTSMSHELRTPLNGMIGFLDLLAEEDGAGPLNEKQRLYLLRSRTATDHLLRLVTDLLDLTRIEAGRLELSPEVVSVAAAIGDVLTMMEQVTAAKQLTVTVEVPGDIKVFADPARFRQIFQNLLTNAVKYTPAGGTVGVRALAEGRTLIAAVHDTGVGIPAEDQQSIFDHFYQARQRDSQSGAGLGLSIVRKLVELHCGTISVASTVGEGSCFTFTLPDAVVSK